MCAQRPVVPEKRRAEAEADQPRSEVTNEMTATISAIR